MLGFAHRVAESNQTSPRHRVSAKCIGLLVALLAAASGCDSQSRVHIDNGDTATMIVEVDDQPVATIEPGQFETIALAPGKYRFHVKCGGRTVYHGTKTVAEAESLACPRQYLFNPDAKHRYAACKVVYGSTVMNDCVDEAIVTFAEHQMGKKADRNRLHFMQLKRYAEPMPSSSWFELPRGLNYILRDAPDHVYSRTGSTSRRALTRIPHEVHAQLRRSHSIKSPTEQDVYRLVDSTERALDSMAQLGTTDQASPAGSASP